jgi:signal transduction histidine kinase
LNPALGKLQSVGDANLLHNVMVNLFKNAIKYSLPRQRNEPMVVRVLGQTQGSWDVIQVVNWGVGIPSEQRELIFEKFYRVERIDRRRAIRGMGLGLYISRLFVTAHRGRVTCRSSEPTLDDSNRVEALEGYDTMFELRIPRTQMLGIQHVKLI